MKIEISELQEKFYEEFGKQQDNPIAFFSPGRINLIGDHIDYNGGIVLPVAISVGTYGIAVGTSRDEVRAISLNTKEKIKFSLQSLDKGQSKGMDNYIKGMFKYISEKGYNIGGMDILIKGNLPVASGLSSSASLEILIGQMINHIYNEDKISPLELVKCAVDTENKFVGVNCGIMDQFIVAMGKKDKAVALKCSNMEYKYVDFDLGEYCLMVMNTKKPRQLRESKYNERRAQCDKALEVLNSKVYARCLCDLTARDFENYGNIFNDNILKSRAEHVVLENQRVLSSIEYLKENNLKDFGTAMVLSHNSLDILYEVAGNELNSIVDEALRAEGCIGARMTGAGFGGCAIALVHSNFKEKFVERVNRKYKESIGYDPEVFEVKVVDGAGKIE